MAGNVLRGALGSALREVVTVDEYARIFRPSASATGPSGLADRPRPFVLRAAELDGRTVEQGERFCFGLNVFDARDSALEPFERAFSRWAELISVERSAIAIDLSAVEQPVSRVRVDFQTPIDLKSAEAGGRPSFAVLLARIRDRISTLRALYGAGPLEIDFRAFAERARSVQTLREETRRVARERRSTRTGQRHGIGGLIGFAEYEGDLAEFVPYLNAAYWTGVGRHCAWGNGQIATAILTPEF